MIDSATCVQVVKMLLSIIINIIINTDLQHIQPSKQCVVGLNPTRAALFSFLRKRVVWVSCLALFYIYRS